MHYDIIEAQETKVIYKMKGYEKNMEKKGKHDQKIVLQHIYI